MFLYLNIQSGFRSPSPGKLPSCWPHIDSFFFSLPIFPTMKKVLLLAGLAIALVSAAHAKSGGDASATAQARATALTRIQAEKARLDEGQYLKVKQLNIRMFSEMEDLKTRFAADLAILDERLAVAQVRYEMELTAIMRPAQLAMFQKSRNTMTALSTSR